MNTDDTIKNILEYMRKIQRLYNVKIHYQDVVGLRYSNGIISKISGDYYSHDNDFCNYIKSHSKCFNSCVDSKALINTACLKKKGVFYGRCYFGIEELCFPVILYGNLIAIISVGLFFSDEQRVARRIEKRVKQYSLDKEKCLEKYFKSTHKIDFSMDDLIVDINIMCEYILLLAKNLTADEVYLKKKNDSGFIVENTVDFISKNYIHDLTLDLLAKNCHCNSSYLSYVFKKKMNIGIVEYINNIRINASKNLLIVTKRSITEIATQVGFNNSNYFSFLFKELNGISPTSYRNKKN